MKRTLPILFGLVLACSPASAEIVDTCGQSVASGELTADLDCSASTGFAVVVEHGGSLDLAGHDIVSGAAPQSNSGGAILCQGDCDIDGGGGMIISAEYPDPLHRPVGVLIPHRHPGRITITDLTVRRYSQGVSALRVTLNGVTGLENQVVVTGKMLRVANSSFTGNGQGAAARRIVLRDSEIADNGNGITARRAVIRRSTITGHDIWGVNVADGLKEGQLTASNTVFEDNCQEQGYGTDCWDFATSSVEAPELENVDCVRSGRFIIATQTWTDWNVCTDD